MHFDIWIFTLDNLDAAGVIGGYVSVSIIMVALVTFFSKNSLKKNTKVVPKWSHSFMGTLLGVIPGCGGTIVASSLYLNKKISFGGLLAAFITTLGEGSFVLLGASAEANVASNLRAFIVVNIVGATVGLIVGSIVDLLGLKKEFKNTKPSIIQNPKIELNSKRYAKIFNEKIGFYVILGISIFLAPGSVMALWGGSLSAIEEITILLCVILTVTSIVFYLIQRFVLKQNCHIGTHSNIRNVLLDAVTDISMVITYVFVGLFIANFIIDFMIGPEQFNNWMSSSKFIVIIMAALIGATPGCGGMISVAVAYITLPNFPMAALIAGSIATSGDGIFALIAESKKDAVVITGYSLVVALLVGFTALALGF